MSSDCKDCDNHNEPGGIGSCFCGAMLKESHRLYCRSGERDDKCPVDCPAFIRLQGAKEKRDG